MRKLAFLGSVLALVLFMGLGLSSPSTVAAAESAPVVTVNIVFDGYCDGMRVTLDTTTRAASGVRTGSCLPQTPLSGRIVDANTVYLRDNTYALDVFLYRNQTWEYYDDFGNLVNSGTFSFGTPALNGSAPSSVN